MQNVEPCQKYRDWLVGRSVSWCWCSTNVVILHKTKSNGCEMEILFKHNRVIGRLS